MRIFFSADSELIFSLEKFKGCHKLNYQNLEKIKETEDNFITHCPDSHIKPLFISIKISLYWERQKKIVDYLLENDKFIIARPANGSSDSEIEGSIDLVIDVGAISADVHMIIIPTLKLAKNLDMYNDRFKNTGKDISLDLDQNQFDWFCKNNNSYLLDALDNLKNFEN